ASINFRKAIQKDPNSGEAYYKLGLTNLRLKKVADGYQSLNRAVALLPDRPDVRLTFASLCMQLYESDARRPQGLYDQLVKTVTLMASKEPNAYDTLRFQGYVALFDRKLKEGIEKLQKANEIKPVEPEVTIALMQALIQDGRSAEAEK